MYKNFKPIHFLLFGILLISSSCSPEYLKRIERGNDYITKPGFPAFNFIMTSRVADNNETSIWAYISVIESSLIYKNEDGVLKSNAEVIIEINKKGKADAFHDKRVIPLYLIDKINNRDYYNQKSFKLDEEFAVEPGDYNVKVVLIDHNTEKQHTKSGSIKVPNPESKSTFLSNILLFRKPHPDSNYAVINTYDIQSGYDSLKFEYQVTHTQEEPFEVRSTLKKFKADLTLPRRMSDRNYRSSSLEYEGVDYTSFDVIQTSRRTISSTGSITVQVKFADLAKGNYRFETTSKTANGKETFRARDFSVKSENYPALKSPRELAQPLAYLMKRDQYKKMMSIKSPDSLKIAIERFWLKKIKSHTKAKTIMQLYYERVEQANMQFSNFKEGWKTDPGMIYILFGPPRYVDDGFGEMSWFYAFDSKSRTQHIIFDNTQFGKTTFPFDHYILNRSDNLFHLEYQQIQSWLDGSIMLLLQQ